MDSSQIVRYGEPLLVKSIAYPSAYLGAVVLAEGVRHYTLVRGQHCGGGAITTWADGTDAAYGRGGWSVEACEAVCDAHPAQCSGFVFKPVDYACLWMGGTLKPYDLLDHDCYTKQVRLLAAAHAREGEVGAMVQLEAKRSVAEARRYELMFGDRVRISRREGGRAAAEAIGLAQWIEEQQAYAVGFTETTLTWVVESAEGRAGHVLFGDVVHLRALSNLTDARGQKKALYLGIPSASADESKSQVRLSGNKGSALTGSWAFERSRPLPANAPPWCAQKTIGLAAYWIQAICNPITNGIFLNFAQHQVKRAKMLNSPAHFFLDGILPDGLLMEVAAELPDADGDDHGCAKGYTLCSKQVYGDGSYRAFEWGKNMNVHSWNLPPATQMLLAILKSTAWVELLERAFDINGLIPDPGLLGSGVHNTVRGGYLKLHADINFVKEIGVYRRVALFVYLNNDWEENFGGHLEIWNRNVSECHARILPIFGRVAAFVSSDHTFHGHPHALAAPPGRSRRSIAVYYYTTSRPRRDCRSYDCRNSDSTRFAPAADCNLCRGPCCSDMCPRVTGKKIASID